MQSCAMLWCCPIRDPGSAGPSARAPPSTAERRCIDKYIDRSVGVNERCVLEPTLSTEHRARAVKASLAGCAAVLCSAATAAICQRCTPAFAGCTLFPAPTGTRRSFFSRRPRLLRSFSRSAGAERRLKTSRPADSGWAKERSQGWRSAEA